MKKFSRFPAGIKHITSTGTISLLELYYFIKNDIELSQITAILRRVNSKEKQSEFKREELEYVTFGGTFSTRKDSGLLEASGLICIDIDNVANPEHLKNSVVTSSKFLLLAFISPSGNGLKLVFLCNPALNFKENYQAYSKYLIEVFDVAVESIDKSCASISRACFLCHDPQSFLNPLIKEPDREQDIPFLSAGRIDAEEREEDDEIKMNPFELSEFLFRPVELNFEKRNIIENLEALCRICIKSNGDFVEGSRHNWVLKLAFLCNSFGMEMKLAIKYFKQLFKNHPAIIYAKHPFDEIGDLTKPFNDVYEKYSNDFGSWDDKNEVFLTPCLPDEIFDRLPDYFRKLTNLFPDKRERDVFFLGLLTLTSTCFPLVQGVYDKKRVRANLFTFISAPAASGKGVLSWVKKLGDEIHDAFLSEFNQALAEYKSLDEEEQKDIPKPELKRLFVAADNTSASIISNLGINQFFGIIYDNEADTLTKANKSEHGHFSNLLRKGFHHESIHYERKTNNQNIFIKEPAFSILVSGTPGQIERLVDDVENGLTSRFVFYDYVSPVTWKDVFADGEDLHGIFKSCASELYVLSKRSLFDFISNPEQEVLFELTGDQKDLLNEWFKEKTKCLDGLYGSDIRGCLFRLGLISFRIGMILSSVRCAEGLNKIPNPIQRVSKITCTNADFETAMVIVQTLLHHTVNVYNKLRKKGMVKRNKNIKYQFYEHLPEKFTRQQAMDVASLMQIKEKTAEVYLAFLIKDGKLERPQQNYYLKVAA